MKKALVFLEAKDNSLKRSSAEAITAALSLGIPVCGVIVANTTAAQEAAAYGLSECIIMEHALLSEYSSQAMAAAVASVASTEGADVILFSGNSTGKEVAPRVAVRLQAGLIPDVVALSVNNGEIHATRPVFAGKASTTAKATTPAVVLSLRPNVFTAKKADSAASLSTRSITPQISDNDRKVVVKNVIRNEGKLDVLEADIVVSGGRGLKGPEHFHLVEGLASTLGAAVGASRAVVDAGWRPHGEQVGQTGKTVSPNLYVACGISGAVQHLAGMSSSKFIVAINKDKEAPIFKVADYGIVGDVFEILPKLTAKVAEITGKN